MKVGMRQKNRCIDFYATGRTGAWSGSETGVAGANPRVFDV